MRILYVGELAASTRCAQRARALRALGHRLTPISHAVESLDGRPPPASLAARLCHRLGWPLDRAGLNRQLSAALELNEFELLWVECGRALWPSTLRELRRRAPAMRALLFSEDDLFLPHNRSRFQSGCLPLYDLVVTTKRRNQERGELASLGARRVCYEPKSYDPELFRPREPSPAERQALGAPILFVGSYEAPRAAALLALAQAGLGVRVFGNGWQRLRRVPSALRIEGRPLLAREYALAIAASELSLGFLRHQNRDQHTDRSIEIPAAGGLLLAERSAEHLELFAEGREALYFADDRELVEVARAALAQPERCAAIRGAGRQRVLTLGLDHRGACQRILASLFGSADPSSPAAAPAPAAGALLATEARLELCGAALPRADAPAAARAPRPWTGAGPAQPPGPGLPRQRHGHPIASEQP